MRQYSGGGITVRKFGLAFFVSILLSCVLLPLPISFADVDGLALLKQAAERYAATKTYEIKTVEETTTSTLLSRDWQKTITTAIQGTGNRFRFETQSSSGSSIRVSDGKTETIYHPEDHEYTQHAVSASGPSVSQAVFGVDLVEFHAIQTAKSLAELADEYTAAQLLPDAAIALDGRPVECYVVKVTGEDLKKAPKQGTTVEKTVWIDKSTMVIRQIITKEHMPNPFSPHVFQDVETIDQYPVGILNAQPEATEFVFDPPQDSVMVEKFRSPFSLGTDLSGQAAPPVTFKSSDGKEISLGVLKGKPVLIDFWATWCLPCMASMPQMAALYQETKDKGLVFMAVDEDKDAKTAADYMSEKHEPFPNFHDSGEIGKALKQVGLPYTVLIDAQGKIVFSKTGYSDDSPSELRAAIAKLGPEFSSVSKIASK
jgi:thiol-disulfide isomerase/thioredoxin